MIKQKRNRITGQPPSLTVRDRAGNLKFLQAGKYTRLLGGNVSNNLTWTDHLTAGEGAILPKLRKQIGALSLLSNQLPEFSRLLLANGLLMSKVSYLIQVWGSAPKSQLKKYKQLDTDMIITTVPPRLLTVANSYRWKTIGAWNQLEMDIHKQHSLPKFKKSVKKWICEH